MISRLFLDCYCSILSYFFYKLKIKIVVSKECLLVSISSVITRTSEMVILILWTLRSELVKSISDTESELSRTTVAVQSYESVGREFESVVTEFTRLRSEIENRRWALHELRRHAAGSTTTVPHSDNDTALNLSFTTWPVFLSFNGTPPVDISGNVKVQGRLTG